MHSINFELSQKNIYFATIIFDNQHSIIQQS